MSFYNIISKIPSYPIYYFNNIGKLILPIEDDQVHNKIKKIYGKNKFYFYYLYKKFNIDIALKILEKYIINCFINLSINNYYKLGYDYKVKLYNNQLIFARSNFKSSEYNNIFTVCKICNINSNLTKQDNIILPNTFISIEHMGINIILNDAHTKILKIMFKPENIGNIKSLEFNVNNFHNNQVVISLLLEEQICFCNECNNQRKYIASNNSRTEIKTNIQNYINPLQHNSYDYI